MGQKLLRFYEDAKRLGGLTAQIRLAVITKIPGTKAESTADTPENIALFERAIEEIKKNISKKQPN